MSRRVGLVRSDVSEELSASFITVTRISEIRRTLVTANVVLTSQILVTLIMETPIPPKRLFLQEPHGVTSQKASFSTIPRVPALAYQGQ
jgi:hypothetical protein